MKSLVLLEELHKYEMDFCHELESKEIKLLRDIKISRVQLKEITDCISVLFKSNEYEALGKKFPLTTSLFLVWSAVYDYKDGDFWGMIFDNLNIKGLSGSRKIKYQSYLGDVFLNTIRKYNLLSIDSTDSKKYLSPILMHSYISNHYAGNFFDYLNRVYTILLKNDVSEDSIERIWKDVFESEYDNKNLENEIKELEKIILELKEEKREYSIPIDMLSIDKTSIAKQERYIDKLAAEITEEEERLDNLNDTLTKLNKAIQYIDELNTPLEKLKSYKSYIINTSRLNEIIDNFNELKNTIDEKLAFLETKRRNIIKNIKGLKKQLTIEQDKVKSIKMDITTLGQGKLDDGWYVLERSKEINEQLGKLEKLLEKKRDLYELSEGIQNTSLKQVLTSSLNHLYRVDKMYFKDFIIDTFQLMDAVYKGEEADYSHPLYDVFCEWCHSYKTKTVINQPASNKDIKTLDYKDDDYSGIDEKSKYRPRMELKGLTKPNIELDFSTRSLVLNVPEQKFDSYIYVADKPKYSIVDSKGNETELPINIYFDGKALYIQELIVPIKEAKGQSFLFKYYNLRESYSLDLDSIMIFDEKGKLLLNNRLNNGLYYIICDNNWYTDFSGILDIYPHIIEGYNMYQIHLNENKAVFNNKLDNSKVEYIGSAFSEIYMEGLNIVEGITIDDIKVSTGSIPNLIIGLRDIDTTNSRLKLYLNDGLLLDQTLKELMDAEIIESSKFKAVVDLQKLFGRNIRALAYKIKILLEKTDGHLIFYEEFWNLPKTRFIFDHENLLIMMPSGSRIQYKEVVRNSREYSMSLDDEEDKEFSIYYNKVGWLKFRVEVPKFELVFKDRDGNKVEVPENLLVSELDILKDLYVSWETSSSIPKIIYLYDKDRNFETRLYLKNGKASVNLYSYYDVLCSVTDSTSLCFSWTGGSRKSNDKNIISIYKKWEVNKIEYYQMESDDEFIIELSLHSNFKKKDRKFLRVVNEGNLLFEKNIVDDKFIIYIKKSQLKSFLIDIEVGYFEDIDDFFAKETVEVIAGKKELELISKINQLDLIMKKGIVATGFKYRGKSERFKVPFIIDNIHKTEPINFIGEELYTGQVIFGNNSSQVIFYINLEKRIIPFLLDLDRDGAQYDPLTGEVFWENRSEKQIMGPIEDITYDIREE